MRRIGSLSAEAIVRRRAIPCSLLPSSSSSVADSPLSSLDGEEVPRFRFFLGCVRHPFEDVTDEEEAEADSDASDSDSDESVSCSPKTPLSSSSRPSLSSISLRLRRLSTRLNIVGS